MQPGDPLVLVSEHLDALHLAIVWSARLAGLAAGVNALELLRLRESLSETGVWRDSTLAPSWGALRLALVASRFRVVLLLQLAGACLLFAFPGTPLGGVAALGLCVTTLLSASRFRGTVNGGSDAMLFTVLGGLAIAQQPWSGPLLREAGFLYVAAQLSLSYARAGFVKIRERTWWTGAAMASFVALPAYGVPAWVPSDRGLLRVAGVGVLCFECLSPLAWVGPVACNVVIAAAVLFHGGAAAVFGLNRFLLAWCAALPALWYAAQRVA